MAGERPEDADARLRAGVERIDALRAEIAAERDAALERLGDRADEIRRSIEDADARRDETMAARIETELERARAESAERLEALRSELVEAEERRITEDLGAAVRSLEMDARTRIEE